MYRVYVGIAGVPEFDNIITNQHSEVDHAGKISAICAYQHILLRQNQSST